jgi:D-glycero-D-manno-heptose 1,7-bisphosphate phosphatase
VNLWQPALFLDRDGVINIDHGYVHQVENFDFIPGIFELVRIANESGFRVVVITNQAGIARGYYSEETFFHLTKWMLRRFTEEGATVDAVYHCPHHPSHGLGVNKLDCQCRKPQPGLLLQAIGDLAIARANSIIIGDKLSDMEAGQRAGLRHLFLLKHNNLSGLNPKFPIGAVKIASLLDPVLLQLLRPPKAFPGVS